jgi:hypothetical protein
MPLTGRAFSHTEDVFSCKAWLVLPACFPNKTSSYWLLSKRNQLTLNCFLKKGQLPWLLPKKLTLMTAFFRKASSPKLLSKEDRTLPGYFLKIKERPAPPVPPGCYLKKRITTPGCCLKNG